MNVSWEQEKSIYLSEPDAFSKYFIEYRPDCNLKSVLRYLVAVTTAYHSPFDLSIAWFEGSNSCKDILLSDTRVMLPHVGYIGNFSDHAKLSSAVTDIFNRYQKLRSNFYMTAELNRLRADNFWQIGINVYEELKVPLVMFLISKDSSNAVATALRLKEFDKTLDIATNVGIRPVIVTPAEVPSDRCNVFIQPDIDSDYITIKDHSRVESVTLVDKDELSKLINLMYDKITKGNYRLPETQIYE